MMRKGIAFLAILLFVPSIEAHSAQAAVPLSGQEVCFFNAINNVRAQHGVAPLQANDQLTITARGWSGEMAASNTLSHNPALFNAYKNEWNYLGENVGTGGDCSSVEPAFEASSHHFENMIDPNYQVIGVGVVSTSSAIWVTEDFAGGSRLAPAPTQSPPTPQPIRSPRPTPPVPTSVAHYRATSIHEVVSANPSATSTTFPPSPVAPTTTVPSTTTVQVKPAVHHKTHSISGWMITLAAAVLLINCWWFLHIRNRQA